jgi:glycosyltransferase involved in cell wall biosynthesis
VAVLAVVTSSPPSVEGGHLVIARALVEAARAVGYDAYLIVTPDYGFGHVFATYSATLKVDVSRVDGRRVDQVISLRYPSFGIRHRAHVCWLNHAMREYYDLWPRFSATLSAGNRVKEAIRRTVLHVVDRHLLKRHVTRVVAQSYTIQARLLADFGIHADVVHPPPPQRPYRCDTYGDYIFAVSRLDPLKRVDLLVRALAEAPARNVKAVIGGEGDSAGELRALARSLNVTDRVQFVGRVDEASMLTHLARCRAVCFTPYAEDYGFVTAEAFASRKAVITCRDSGGPTELVRDEENGVVCDPTPASLAIALARLSDDRRLAERLGSAAAARAAAMSWDAAVRRLVIV